MKQNSFKMNDRFLGYIIILISFTNIFFDNIKNSVENPFDKIMLGLIIIAGSLIIIADVIKNNKLEDKF